MGCQGGVWVVCGVSGRGLEGLWGVREGFGGPWGGREGFEVPEQGLRCGAVEDSVVRRG